MALEKFLNLDDLSLLIGRSKSTIKNDLRRSPHKVPTPIAIPGQRSLRWHPRVVEQWLNDLAATAQAQSQRGGKK